MKNPSILNVINMIWNKESQYDDCSSNGLNANFPV